MLKTDFFLGANSPSGFYSLYDQLCGIEGTTDFIILKGGPGVGKSTFMKHIALCAKQQGLDREYIHCSGDSASLDALLLPQKGILIADGTAPHVIEPAYPAAIDRYVNLGCFYDVDAVKKKRDAIVACTRSYKICYDRAYACLRARRAVAAEAEDSLRPCLDTEKLSRRLLNLWTRERKKRRGGEGAQTLRFCHALTPSGYVFYEETIAALAGHVCVIFDPYHLAAPTLSRLRDTIRADGFDLTVCLDPNCPTRIAHLIIPGADLAFVTADSHIVPQIKPWRTVHVDRMLNRDLYRLLRGSLRLKGRLCDALEEEGAAHLAQAGQLHEKLEALYHPHVDFDGVIAAAESECRRFFH